MTKNVWTVESLSTESKSLLFSAFDSHCVIQLVARGVEESLGDNSYTMPYQHKAQAYSALTFLKDHANLTADIFRLYGAWKIAEKMRIDFFALNLKHPI